MTHKLTLVTGLFDIGRGQLDTDFKRPFSHYIECFEKLLKVNYPMIIYIEKENEHIVWKHRSRTNTQVIHKSLDDLRNFPFYDKIQKIRNDPKWYSQASWLQDSTQAKLELYDPLVMSKMFMLNDATIFNTFSTKYYAWIDAGLANTVNLNQYIDDNFEKKLTPHLNKMLFVAFPYDGKYEVHGFTKAGMNKFAGKDTEYVCRGGFFGGSRDAINSCNGEYYQLLHETLNVNEMGTEENIFTLLTYREPKKYNVKMIESNGLLYKFFEDLSKNIIESEPEFPIAVYALTYNTPSEFKSFVESYQKAYPKDFTNHKKYVIDNSTDKNAKVEYRKLFTKYDFEIIHEGSNIGIQDGRQKAATHFDTSDHKYYMFFEEDFKLVASTDNVQNVDGFIRYVPDMFNVMIDIIEDNNLDYLRATIIEFFGDNLSDWSFKNVPADKRELYFPIREDGNEELRWKSKVEYLGKYKNVAYAVGHFHYSNWPIMFNKEGNRKVFLNIVYEHLYEQTLCSACKTYMMDGKLKVGTLLAAPVYHERKTFYDGKTRRENRHYTN